MNHRCFTTLPAAALLALLLWSLLSTPVNAQQNDCGEQRAVDHAFASGATWSLCVSIEESHGLTIQSARYRAPGDSLRPVLAEAHLGQLLLHYHDSRSPVAQIDPSQPAPDSPEASDIIVLNGQTCNGTPLDVSGRTAAVCSRVKDNHILAKFAQRPSIQSKKLEISSAFQRETLTWTTRFSFSEDGQIHPSISLSGRAIRTTDDANYGQAIPADTDALTRATVLATWRLVFDLDTAAVDRVQQFDFPLNADNGNRRPMHISSLETERLLQVDRESFRGWRIMDGSGAGYYLDPANSGFRYRSLDLDWAQADGAVTAFHACERHAWLNSGDFTGDSLTGSDDSIVASDCGTSLDDFTNNESLQEQQPVLWYSLSRTLDPRIEDWPVLRDVSLQFDLMPFDWTASSPFEVND